MSDRELQNHYEEEFHPRAYAPGVGDWYRVIHSFIESKLHDIFDESKLEHFLCWLRLGAGLGWRFGRI